ncbi:MAG TPA: DEAD/DEAH box helicase family protein [Fibrobacteria bacterium]|nr:DEAD/DEAH box helicase family protein [Fibrobacteria bacterium]
MARPKGSGKSKPGAEEHKFRDKLLLNQWLISQFGIDPLDDAFTGSKERPFHRLAAPLRDAREEGLDHDGLHRFFHALTESELFHDEFRAIPKARLQAYEENIGRHTKAINERRARPVVWKYYQWLSLLFVEIYLDRWFADCESLLADLNAYVARFNAKWPNHADMPEFVLDDLNKLSLQNATGSGKTLLMHVNVLQYRHYASQYGRSKDLSRAILITPNESLSLQHIDEFRESGIEASNFAKEGLSLFTQERGLGRVDVLEITKLGDKEGPNTVATRSLGDQNLLLVDEGHRGMSGKDEGVWFTRRSDLCAKGFTFEYSATFEQAVQASGNANFVNSYAKTIVFDYSYRWFYEDGFGKDYQILNLPKSYETAPENYLTACLLKFYQQQCIYEDRATSLAPFNLEKPLWVFVGSTVASTKLTKDEQIVATDVALILEFFARFLADSDNSCRRIHEILHGRGQDTGLLDSKGVDIFDRSFDYLAQLEKTPEDLFKDILKRLFNAAHGGHLALERVKGDSGEIVLRVGTSETPFGLINVGDAKSLADHLEAVAKQKHLPVTVDESDFTEAQFATVKESTSPVNLLIGSKKFIEGWDCWRVSTLGLMHVGKSEGAQIIQLFGRGVRLKGHGWSLKRSGHVRASRRPEFIWELETLNVFGIEADFMERFKKFLEDEGLPGNERRNVFTIPLNITYDFGKKLKIVRPKKKASDGKEYDFKKDGPVPGLHEVPEYIRHHRVVADWYPRIQSIQSRKAGEAAEREPVALRQEHLCLLDYDALYFEVERYKRDRSWHNFNIDVPGIRSLLADNTWYTLYLPHARLDPQSFEDVRLLQLVARDLVTRYCEAYYNFKRREFLEPRLEVRELRPDDDNIPQDEFYQLIVDGDDKQVIAGIEAIKRQIEEKKTELLQVGDLKACLFGAHLFQPLFHLRKGGKITILPVALNESEFQFVTDLKSWTETNKRSLEDDGIELYLLRNLSRGKGVGFFEAGGFHPDFILWMVVGDKQFVTFIEPHGLLHEGQASDKILFREKIKEIEARLKDPDLVLNSFILSWTPYPQLRWGISQQTLESQHVLFMTDDRDGYIEKLFKKLKSEIQR